MKRPPADTMPEIKGLTISAGHLMIKAKGHQARGEPFEAAVVWIKAGHCREDLADRLIKAGYVREGAEELLNAAYCFLEAGDYRPASRLLDRFENGSVVGDAKKHEHIRAEYEDYVTWCKRRQAEFEKAKKELRKQMAHADAADKLRVPWLDDVLASMPGVVDWHWFASQKYEHEGRFPQAIRHHDCCVRLRSDEVGYWVAYVNCLILARKFAKAMDVAQQGLAQHAGSAIMLFFSGWARLRGVTEGHAPDPQLSIASGEFRSALQIDGLNEHERVVATCMLSFCLKKTGHRDEARRLLEDAVRMYPVRSAGPAERMLKATSEAAERTLLKKEASHVLLSRAA